jgi:hypothetical protein
MGGVGISEDTCGLHGVARGLQEPGWARRSASSRLPANRPGGSWRGIPRRMTPISRRRGGDARHTGFRASELWALRAYPIRRYCGYPVGKTSLPAEPDPCVTSQRTSGVSGGDPTNGGRVSRRCSRPGSHLHAGATGRAAMSAGPWLPASSCVAPGAHGTPCRTRAAVPGARRSAASKRGRPPGVSWPSGHTAWLGPRPCRALTGRGGPGTGR